MRAVVISEGSLSIEERPDPVPGPRDVVVDVAAAGLNAADLLQRRGFYPAPPGWPVDVPGMEIAGTIVAIGEDVRGRSLGQRVCAVVGGGGQATRCLVPSEHLLDVPSSTDLIHAGGFPEAYTTAYDAITQAAHFEPGTRVLISGAAGGVGSAAVQVAAALGAHVIAVTRDDRFHDRLRALGAAEVTTIDHVGALEPVDVVIELVGAAHLAAAMNVLAPHATVVVIGVGGGSRVEVDFLAVMTKRLRLTGSTLRSRSRTEKALLASSMVREVVPLWAANAVHVDVHATFPLEEVESAYDAFAAGGKFGKIILTTG